MFESFTYYDDKNPTNVCTHAAEGTIKELVGGMIHVCFSPFSCSDVRGRLRPAQQ